MKDITTGTELRKKVYVHQREEIRENIGEREEID
jgi:hypothetical protein